MTQAWFPMRLPVLGAGGPAFVQRRQPVSLRRRKTSGFGEQPAVIRRVLIRNYRRFRDFDMTFAPGVNTLVGANDTGKSTLIEAINLALTGRVNGRPLSQALSPYLVNASATKDYIAALRAGTKQKPPTIVIEVYFADAELTAILRGTNNLLGADACGVRIQAVLSEDFQEEYESFASEPASVRLVPTEYFRVEWLGFSGNGVTTRSIPASATVIDPTTFHWQSGVDHHMQQILRTNLEVKERVELSRQYRSVREEFSENARVKEINERLKSSNSAITDRSLSIAIDISQRSTWEGGLTAHLDDLPFPLIGRGEQNALKTVLALGRKADDAHVVLLEEPEAHLSFEGLRRLLGRIEKQCEGKQVIIATHSTFVLNKLGLETLALIGPDTATRITDLDPSTVEYFKKLAGFDTLRLVLARSAILVEGPSDELVVQRAYRDAHKKLPIEDGIDVISVGLSHKRFLDIAVRLKRRVRVVTDNDHKTVAEIKQRFSDYLSHDCVSLHTDPEPSRHTLEPAIVAVNDLETMNKVLGTTFATTAELEESMRSDKTTAALAIFESATSIVMPGYIRDAVTD